MIYLTPYLQMGLGALGIYLGGGFIWTGFMLLFFLLPLIEFTLSNYRFGESFYSSSGASASLLLTPIALTALLGLVFWRALQIESPLELAGLILSAGTLMGAYGITSAHELVHRRDQKLRAIGVYNLMLVNFAHWGLEHVFGHHKHVATPLDPATARKGEMVYAHWVRNYFGGLKGAWNISKFKFSFYWLTTILLSVVSAVVFGPKIMFVWWAISLVAILLLQTVDYIEHYGLRRPQNQDGFYTAFKSAHSWDTNSTWTNITLFNLGRHSHHHMKATLPYEQLTEQIGARRMPYGYSVMVPLALAPWVYIPMMNKVL